MDWDISFLNILTHTPREPKINSNDWFALGRPKSLWVSIQHDFHEFVQREFPALTAAGQTCDSPKKRYQLGVIQSQGCMTSWVTSATWTSSQATNSSVLKKSLPANLGLLRRKQMKCERLWWWRFSPALLGPTAWWVHGKTLFWPSRESSNNEMLIDSKMIKHVFDWWLIVYQLRMWGFDFSDPEVNKTLLLGKSPMVNWWSSLLIWISH